MKAVTHVIPADVFRSLARGTGGAEAARLLVRAERSKLNLLLRSVVTEAEATSHPHAPMARAGYRLLARIQRVDADSVAIVLRTPAVHAWAQLTATALAGARRHNADVGRLATIALAAAVKSGYACEIEIPGLAGEDRSIDFPALGRAGHIALSDPRIRARFVDGTLTLADAEAVVALPRRFDADAPGWMAVRTLSASHGAARLDLRIDDLDPYRFTGEPRPGARLDAREAGEWQSHLSAAWHVLAEHHRTAAEEIALSVSTLCPLAAASAAGLSATSRITPGCIGLSRPADGLSLALTLIHEVQHVKLAGLLDLVPMFDDDATENVHYAPWRQDPRPLVGLLQGAYAHLAIADFWRIQRRLAVDPAAEFHAQVQFVRWWKAVSEVTAYLFAAPGLTPHGRRFAAEMRVQLRRWQREQVSQTALDAARRLAAAHRARWEKAHGGGSAVDQRSISANGGHASWPMVS